MYFLEKLEEYAKSTAPIYMDFLHRYDPKKKQVFAFYEGKEDSCFYSFVLKKFIDKDCALEEIVAGCKNNVIKLQKNFDWKVLDKKQIIFFIDRDLSYWLDENICYDENVFVTKGYSVENYVVNSEGFRAWLTRYEGFSIATKKEIEAMVAEYTIVIEKFKKKIMSIMAKAVVAKRHNSSIKLGDFKISKDKSIFFSLHENHIHFEIKIEDKILEKWKITDEHCSEITKQIECFEKNIEFYSVRGKWLLCFMAEVGEYMRLNFDKFAPSLVRVDPFIKKLSHTCHVSTSQCFSVIAPYCIEPIPPELQNFLDKTYKLYMANYQHD